jgi:hypothetical protein
LSDWLILQGNVVIATDSVDGISRLATQTEANDGTEAGAVVITPATLQGKIDAQITPEISNKLPLTGGTMTGNIDMNYNDVNNAVLRGTLIGDTLDAQNNSIANLAAPTNGGDAANKTYVDDNTSNKLPLAGGTMSGNINMSGNEVTGASAVRTGNLYSSSTGDSIYVQENLDFENEKSIINLPAPTNDGDAANKIYVDDADALKLDLAGGTMTGNINLGGNNIQGVNSIGVATIYTERLDNSYGHPIYLEKDLDATYGTIINLPAPTADGDAANKLYVDTTVAAQSFTATIATGDWTALGDQYEAGISHNLGTMFLSVTTLHGNETADFLVETALNGNISTIYSNFVPANDVHVSLIKANGNL